MKTKTKSLEVLDNLAAVLVREYVSNSDSVSTDELLSSIENEFRSTVKAKLDELLTVRDEDVPATVDPSSEGLTGVADFPATMDPTGEDMTGPVEMPVTLDPTSESAFTNAVDVLPTVEPSGSGNFVSALPLTIDSDNAPIAPVADDTNDEVDQTIDSLPVDSKAPTVRRGKNSEGNVQQSAVNETMEGGSALDSKTDFTVSTPQNYKAPPDYEVQSVLGKGGMGIVFKARHIPLDRTVAVKMILAGSNASADQLKRFQAEAEAAAHLSHPNIVSVYEVGEHDGLPYFSLEFVEGNAMSDLLKQNTMTPRDAAELLLPVARAIEYSHQQGVLHRDLKPQNILVSDQGVPKVADFGLAKRLDAEEGQTVEGVVMGTPGYMAPEQASETSKVGPRSDVYSLGCILYYSMTGRAPFAAPTPLETVRQLLFDDPVMPSKLQGSIDRDLETICMKAIEKELPKRYQSAGEFADELERFLNGEPIVARPISRQERLLKWCRRNPKVAALTATAATLLLTLLFGGIISAVVINQKKKAEQAARQDAESNALLAEDQAELAMDTTRVVLYKTKDFFESKPELKPLREQVIQTIVQSVEDIHTDQSKGFGTDVLRASSNLQLAEIYTQLGQYEKAAERAGLCRETFKEIQSKGKLSKANISEMKIAMVTGDAMMGLGEFEEAKEEFQELLKLRTTYFEQNEDRVREGIADASIADALGRLANAELQLGLPTDALTHAKKAESARRLACQLYPKSVAFKRELAGATGFLSTVYERLGEQEPMLKYSKESLQLQQELAARVDDIVALTNLGIAHKVLSRQHLQLGKYAGAESPEATQLWNRLIKKDDKQLKLLQQAADYFYYQGLALLRQGKDSTAVFDRAAELQRKVVAQLDTLHTKGMMLKILAAAGKAKEASELAGQIEKSGKTAYHYGYVAVANSLLLEHLKDKAKQQAAEKAIESTRQMIRGGYSDFVGLRKTELEFVPLHSNQDYQRMLNEEEARIDDAAKKSGAKS